MTDRLGAEGGRLTEGELTPTLVRDLPEPAREAFRTGVVNGLHRVVKACTVWRSARPRCAPRLSRWHG
ncbi:hypothetical protein [Streptomyces sp. SID5643]|uniref:hypothetical protein n=1 Tax=Streptomyces sp. SID5643 TaxID=2690307 RepID=UPI001F30D803|nr:hypothetical protein [Streptomyces sp. SID5643]